MHIREKLLRAVYVLAFAGLALASCAPAAAPPVQPTAQPAAAAAPTKAPAALSPEAAGKPATPAPKPGEPTPSSKPGTDQPRYGGILDRANFGDPANLDIHQETSVTGHAPLANFYNGLVKYDTVELDKVAPDLAERWEVSPEGTTWTFHLRKGVRWHDGRPFTSEDARFSLERMAFWKEHKIVSPRSGAMLTTVERVEAPDQNTVKVTLKYPSASFIANAASGWVLMLPKHVIQAKGDMKKDVNGTGPFKLKTYTPGTAWELVKNPEYFITGRPYLDGIRVFVIKDDATRLAAFRTGRVKMTPISSKGLTHAEAEIVRKEMSDTAVVYPHAAFLRFMFLCRVSKAPWNDVRVRKAIDLAFDRQSAVKLNFNVGSLGAAMDSNGMWGIPEEEMKQKPGYRQPKDADIAEAKRLMAAAGYSNGFKTTILVRSGGTAEKLGVFAKGQLDKIGIDADIDVKEFAVVTELYGRHAFEIAPTYFSDPADDPDAIISAYYVTGGSRNYGDFSDKQVDELFEKQARALDSAERKKLVRQIQETLLDLVPYPIFYWDVYNMGWWKEVRGYKPGGGAYSHNSLGDVWLAK